MGVFRKCLVLSAVVLSGCATQNMPTHFLVFVDSISGDGAPSSMTYVIGSGDKQISSGDLQFREYASQIERAIADKGYVKAQNPDDAAVLVALTYGISDPKDTSVSYSLPVFGQTGVASSTTYGRVGAGGTFTGTTYNTPSFGVTGYVPVTDNHTTYNRHFVATAFDLAASKKLGRDVQLWRTTVTSTGSSNDLRRVFPYMVYAAHPYFGGNTGRKIEVTVQEDQPEVVAYRASKAPGLVEKSVK